VREIVLNQNMQDANLSQNMSAFGIQDESVKNQSLSFGDGIRQQMSNMTSRDVIE
jgi:Phosphatidylinositol-4-phosphate 5-Kinase